jgi:DNA replication protein DnaC
MRFVAPSRSKRCWRARTTFSRKGDRCASEQLVKNIARPTRAFRDVIGDPNLADAILDRIVHNAHRLQLRGDSLRKQTSRQ